MTLFAWQLLFVEITLANSLVQTNHSQNDTYIGAITRMFNEAVEEELIIGIMTLTAWAQKPPVKNGFETAATRRLANKFGGAFREGTVRSTMTCILPASTIVNTSLVMVGRQQLKGLNIS